MAVKPFTLYRSQNPEKKYDVYVPSPNGESLRRISFGQYGAADYTTHDDIERRDRYRRRHSRDRILDPYTPGFWAWHTLWGETSDLHRAFQHAVSLAKRLIR